MVYNEKTEILMAMFLKHPAGSLIVSGSRFSGVSELIHTISQSILSSESSHNILSVGDTKNSSISIENIRELKKWLTTRFSKGEGISRIVIINNAESMTHEAQNALLKVLEEPVSDTVIILECSEAVKILDTVRSRCQVIKVLPLTYDQAMTFAENMGITPEKAMTAYGISGGESLLFEQLLQDEATEVVQSITVAKSYLSKTVFQRLASQSEFTESTKLTMLIQSLAKVCEAAMTKPHSNVERWASLLKTIKKAEMLLQHNTAPKLVFTYLSVSL